MNVNLELSFVNENQFLYLSKILPEMDVCNLICGAKFQLTVSTFLLAILQSLLVRE